jgi:hypothetical protein
MKTVTFFTVNLQATYGGWVLYKDGELFARSWPSKRDAIRFAKDFCERNGYRFCEAK